MQLDARALADATSEIVRRHVDAAVGPLLKRIGELESRQPERGEAGEQGPQGEPGRDGVGMAGAVIDRDGNLVVTMTDGSVRELGLIVGKDGRDGVDGKDGADGRDGVDGINGKDGLDGTPGADGKDGEPGLPGEKGEPGDAGKDGIDGKDAYPGEARGLYDPEAQYRARDIVALNGSAFMAKQDEPGECPGEGWMLLAGRGKRGDRGERGEQGSIGKDGRDGANPIALAMDGDGLKFLMVLDNGEQLEADFLPIIEKMKGEIGPEARK